MLAGELGARSDAQSTPAIDEDDPLVSFILDEAAPELGSLPRQNRDGRHYGLPIK